MLLYFTNILPKSFRPRARADVPIIPVPHTPKLDRHKSEEKDTRIFSFPTT